MPKMGPVKPSLGVRVRAIGKKVPSLVLGLRSEFHHVKALAPSCLNRGKPEGAGLGDDRSCQRPGTGVSQGQLLRVGREIQMALQEPRSGCHC